MTPAHARPLSAAVPVRETYIAGPRKEGAQEPLCAIMRILPVSQYLALFLRAFYGLYEP